MCWRPNSISNFRLVAPTVFFERKNTYTEANMNKCVEKSQLKWVSIKLKYFKWTLHTITSDKSYLFCWVLAVLQLAWHFEERFLAALAEGKSPDSIDFRRCGKVRCRNHRNQRRDFSFPLSFLESTTELSTGSVTVSLHANQYIPDKSPTHALKPVFRAGLISSVSLKERTFR
jgi:hypothetical protein